MAVCSFCRSTLVRDGDTLRRIGQSAELFDDHSPLGLGARGSWSGEAFTLVGRIQYAYLDPMGGPDGRWTSWHALFDNGRSATLSEDNGAHVMSWPQAPSDAPLPDLSEAMLEQQVSLLGRRWTVSSQVLAQVHALEGEWGFVPRLGQRFPVWELRNAQDEVLSIEGLTDPPQVDVGRSVRLADLKLTGLPQRDNSPPQLRAKGLECPSCGSSLTPTLDTTKTIVCGQCKAVVDISKGLGADLAFYKQDNGLPPLIPLGERGTLDVGGVATEWQVVGYQERRTVAVLPDDEVYFWREYLLYQRSEGFAFLVDALDGWSLVRPITGAPQVKGDRVLFKDQSYRKSEGSYNAETTYVLGEFYWPVRKGQRTLNTDFVGTGLKSEWRLNREMAGNEVTWSQGRALEADAVVQAFGMDITQRRLFKRDTSPVSLHVADSTVVIAVVFFIALILITSLSSCDERCASVRDTYGESSLEYQQCRQRSASGGSHGGSWGGFNSGGFHK